MLFDVCDKTIVGKLTDDTWGNTCDFVSRGTNIGCIQHVHMKGIYFFQGQNVHSRYNTCSLQGCKLEPLGILNLWVSWTFGYFERIGISWTYGYFERTGISWTFGYFERIGISWTYGYFEPMGVLKFFMTNAKIVNFWNPLGFAALHE